MRPIPKRLIAAALAVFAAGAMVALGVALTGRVDRAAPSPSARLPKAAPALAPSPESPTLPAGLAGEWNTIRENCGTTRGDGRLLVSLSRLVVDKAEGRPTAFAGLGGGEFEIEADMRAEPEEPRLVRYRFHLSPDGQSLQAGGRNWFRCQGESPAG